MDFQKKDVTLHYHYSQQNFTTMKNLFTFAVVLFSNVAFGQQLASVNADSSNYINYFEPFLQLNDTLYISGINPEEVKIDLAEYASNVGIRTEMVLVNENSFSDEQKVFIIKASLSEAIEEKCKVVSRLDHFRNKNVQLGGKTPIIERVVTIYAKQGTTIIYNN